MVVTAAGCLDPGVRAVDGREGLGPWSLVCEVNSADGKTAEVAVAARAGSRRRALCRGPRMAAAGR